MGRVSKEILETIRGSRQGGKLTEIYASSKGQTAKEIVAARKAKDRRIKKVVFYGDDGRTREEVLPEIMTYTQAVKWARTRPFYGVGEGGQDWTDFRVFDE